jgi:hypothetical protein
MSKPQFKAIPTMWQGIQFRSRLEARWAAFFTAMGWRWDYEPFDLDGYIPDFILHMHEDVLVEVKPMSSIDDLIATEAIAKIQSSGWGNRMAVVVGSDLFEHEQNLAMGRIVGGENDEGDELSIHDGDTDAACGDIAIVSQCATCEAMTFISWFGTWRCHSCGLADGSMTSPGLHSSDGVTFETVTMQWRHCGNAVQWKRPS